MAALLPLPGLLRELGQDPDRLIGEAGLDLALFQDAENTIPFVAMGRLLIHCAEATQYPHLGLELGLRSGLETLGLLGKLAAAAPDLGGALRAIILYSHLHDRGAVPLLWERGDQAMVGYVIHWPDVPGTHPIYDGALAILFKVLTTLGGPDWRATEVALHPAPNRDLAPYRTFFRCPLRIGARHAAVAFPAVCLTRPLEGADALAYVRVLREIEAMEAPRGIGFRKRVERVLRRWLIAGDPLGGTSLEQMAALFIGCTRAPSTAASRPRARAFGPSLTKAAIGSRASSCAIPCSASRIWRWRSAMPMPRRSAGPSAAGPGHPPAAGAPPSPGLNGRTPPEGAATRFGRPTTWRQACDVSENVSPTPRDLVIIARYIADARSRIGPTMLKIDGSTFTPSSPITHRKIR